MVKADNIRCVPLQSQWSDLGAWPAVWEMMDKDGQGNVARGDVLLRDTKDSYAHSVDGAVLSVVGLDGVLAVATKDAVLVASRDHAQDVSKLVDELKAKGRKQAVEHARIYRPWGWYEGLAEGERYQVKTLMIKPGARLSLQSHHHRAEHWVVVRGTVRVTNGEETFLLSENQSTYIPIGNTHRLENPGKLPAVLIEVQSGAYLGEDDIVRYCDDYGREGQDG
jgi:mannose-1-phosphate guanylyltransferase/mannose-6-phosphate isomerase